MSRIIFIVAIFAIAIIAFGGAKHFASTDNKIISLIAGLTMLGIALVVFGILSIMLRINLPISDGTGMILMVLSAVCVIVGIVLSIIGAIKQLKKTK